MYRTLISVLLYTIAVTAAPQDTVNSDITYVKIQPVTNDSPPPKSPYRESRIENLPLTIPGNVNKTIENPVKRKSLDNRDHDEDISLSNDTIPDHERDKQRRIRSEDTTASYEADTEPTEAITETVEDLVQQTEEYEARTKAPRFLSKLSYFQKDDVGSSIATNLVEVAGKRRFRSKCRCEKIWNCPKLQITVPRCPNEYFLCCF